MGKLEELTAEFLDPKDYRQSKFDDRELIYQLTTAFLFYTCSRKEVREQLQNNDLIISIFNRFQESVDKEDNLLEELRILGKMNLIIYRVMHLVKDSHLGIKSKISHK